MAKELMDIRRTLTPEMELLTAIVGALDEAYHAKIIETLALGVAEGRRSAVGAMAVANAKRMTVGEYVDLQNALRSLEAD